MKFQILISFFLLVNFYSFSQHNVTIKFKDGTTILDSVRSLDLKLKSFKNQKQYKYENISKIAVHKYNKTKHLYVLDVKLNYNSRKSKKGLAFKIYDSEKLELFRVFFGLDLAIALDLEKKINPNYEIFIKRKDENFAYNIGCIDGYGCVKVMKRLKKYFYDCPELIKMLKENKINELDIFKISNYYNKLCG